MVPPLPVALVLSVAGANLIYVHQILPAEADQAPLVENATAQEEAGAALINNSNPVSLKETHNSEVAAGYVLIDKASFLNPSDLSTEVTEIKPGEGTVTYKVEKGDTVSSIAAKFNLPVNSVISANNLTASGKIRPGEEIVILPVTEKPRSKTALSGDDKEEKKVKRESSDTSGYFILPVPGGLNWGKRHDGDAVDISGACGTPIEAAAGGTVTDVGDPDAWNSGYGGFVKISHPNDTVTFYAHTSVNLVSVGDRVSQGSVIADIGNSGRVHGKTGCHVHFDVSGARNPFAR